MFGLRNDLEKHFIKKIEVIETSCCFIIVNFLDENNVCFSFNCKKKVFVKCSFSFNRFECCRFGQAFKLLPLQRTIPSYAEDPSSKGNIESTPTDGFRDQFRLYKFCLRLLYATSTACAAYVIQKHLRKFLSSNFAYAFDCCTI